MERETLVLFSLVLLAVFFGITGFTVKRYHAEEEALGGRWYQRGEAALKANRPAEAVDDFHTALIYARDNTVYQMRLAEALVRAHRLGEADVYLRTLWEQQPGGGTVNLELARLAANSHNVLDALRYYHNAIFGVWEGNPETHRRQVRIELCKFLLAEGERNEAESELIALQADLPPNADVHTQVGLMFLQVDDYQRALHEFQQALKLNPKQPGAAAGAGEAAYQLGDFVQARGYLQKAVSRNLQDVQIAQRLEITKLVLELDPFGRRLSQKERNRRTIAAFNQAFSRLRQCAQTRGVNLRTPQAGGPFADIFAKAKKLQPNVSRSNLQHDPDLITNVMDLVMQMEEAAQEACGTPPAPDQALLIISHTRGVTER